MRNRKYTNNVIEATLLPVYGKKRLLTYADSFRDLAKTYSGANEEPEDADTSSEDRQAYLWQKKSLENRDILAEHLNEMAGIMTQIAEESYSLIKPEDKRQKQVVQVLKEYGIAVYDMYIIDSKNHIKISLELQAMRSGNFSVAEIAGLLSVIFNTRLHPVHGSIAYLREDMETLVFEEEPKFGVLTGTAKAIKEREVVSGDNFSFLEVGSGNFVAALSDGCGCGEKACKDSEMVLDLFEKLLEAGFDKERAANLINGGLIAGGEENNMSTLDICDLDLYTGSCEFLKIGAACTYIKHGDSVERVPEAALPLGIFHEMELETRQYKLEDGEYIIIMSDGVCDSIEENGDELLRELIQKMTLENPREIANYILKFAIHACKGKIMDDMSVLVVGMWENSR